MIATWIPAVLSQIICTILSILASVGISVYVMNRQFKKQDKVSLHHQQVTQQAAAELLSAAKGTLIYFYPGQSSVQKLEKSQSILCLDKLSAINKHLEYISPSDLNSQVVGDFLIDRNILILLEVDLRHKISAVKNDTYSIRYLEELDIPSRLSRLNHTKKE